METESATDANANLNFHIGNSDNEFVIENINLVNDTPTNVN